MTEHLEREIKLRFESAASARAAVLGIGAAIRRSRRLQHDALLDTDDASLFKQRLALRVRREEGTAVLTFKGPPRASTMKVREEIETAGGDPGVLIHIFERLGFRVRFEYEKYREEFVKDDAIIAVDETPVGVFVEIEGSEAAISAVASLLGRTPDQYITDSYRALYARDCEQRNLPVTNMLFIHG